MTTYANWEELSTQAPEKYDDNTTEERYTKGLNQVAPPGMVANAARAKNYATNTNGKGQTWLGNWRDAEFQNE